MTGLVGTLLTLARSDAGRSPLDRAPFDLAEPCVSSSSSTPRSPRRRVSPCGMSRTGAARRRRRSAHAGAGQSGRQRAGPHPAGGKVVAGCRPDDGQIHLWVADTGEGIAPEHQDAGLRPLLPGRRRPHAATGAEPGSVSRSARRSPRPTGNDRLDEPAGKRHPRRACAAGWAAARLRSDETAPRYGAYADPHELPWKLGGGIGLLRPTVGRRRRSLVHSGFGPVVSALRPGRHQTRWRISGCCGPSCWPAHW